MRFNQPHQTNETQAYTQHYSTQHTSRKKQSSKHKKKTKKKPAPSSNPLAFWPSVPQTSQHPHYPDPSPRRFRITFPAASAKSSAKLTKSAGTWQASSMEPRRRRRWRFFLKRRPFRSVWLGGHGVGLLHGLLLKKVEMTSKGQLSFKSFQKALECVNLLRHGMRVRLKVC